jgi:UDP-glucose 4-epimerase
VAGLHALVRPWAVVHLAAMHFVPECERRPALMHRINGGGMACMLDAWAAHRPDRFVFASSAAVYAATGTPLSETAPLAPCTEYGRSKVAAENLLRHRAARAGVVALVVRLFNLYGPAPTTAHLIPAVLAQVRGRGPLRLGDLTTVRDYVYRDDAADAIVALLVRGVGGVVNVGTGTATSGAELVVELGRVLGHRLEPVLDPARLRSLDHPYLVADLDRLSGLLPRWRPLPLAEGLRRTVAADGH